MQQVQKRDRKLSWIATDKVVPNDRNPRSSRQFNLDDPEFRQLQESIKRLGILEPIIVQQYEQGMFLLIEGERRWTVAKNLGIKEIPALVQNKLEGNDQVVLMYNLHENRKGWEMADHLRAIEELRAAKPNLDEIELAAELGMRPGTLRDRLRVLDMGKSIVDMISRGQIDYSSALRASQTATMIRKRRPELTEKLGGEKSIERKLVKKARTMKGGLANELMVNKQDFSDTKHVPDELIETFVENTELSLRDLRRSHEPAKQKRAVDDLRKDVQGIEKRLATFQTDVGDLSSAPGLRKLRAELLGLIELAEKLERLIVDELLKLEGGSNGDDPAPRTGGRTRAEIADAKIDAARK